jgi:ferredoxin
MAFKITDECINCGLCEPECPNSAIYENGTEYELGGETHAPLSNETYYIVPRKCDGCADLVDTPRCVAVCPAECIAFHLVKDKEDYDAEEAEE